MPQPPDKLSAFIVSVGGLGFLPIAPATWASAAIAAPAFFFGTLIPWWWYAVAAALFWLIAMFTIPRVQEAWGKDPARVVIDEAVGMSMVCAMPIVLNSQWWLIAGFVLFRVFDIAKPWPLNKINDRSEAWAVVIDDVGAGVYTIITLHLAVFAVNAAMLALQAP
jgi:phosphatidylglycerophosphatase A